MSIIPTPKNNPTLECLATSGLENQDENIFLSNNNRRLKYHSHINIVRKLD